MSLASLILNNIFCMLFAICQLIRYTRTNCKGIYLASLVIWMKTGLWLNNLTLRSIFVGLFGWCFLPHNAHSTAFSYDFRHFHISTRFHCNVFLHSNFFQSITKALCIPAIYIRKVKIIETGLIMSRHTWKEAFYVLIIESTRY